MTGYCILVVGKMPVYRIVYRPSLNEALSIIPALKKESEGRMEILRIVDGDTKLIHGEDLNGYIED